MHIEITSVPAPEPERLPRMLAADPERLALGHQFHMASSREQAMREAAPHYGENMKMFGELRLVRALIAAMRDPRLVGTVRLPTIEDAVKAGRLSRPSFR